VTRNPQVNTVQTAAGGDVEGFLLVDTTEDAVGGQDRRLDVGEFVAEWIENDDAETAFRADGGVNVAFFVDRQSVDSGFVAEIVQNRFCSE